MKLDELRASGVSTDSGKSLRQISDMLEKVIQETQTLTYDLGSPTLYELGLEVAVKEWLTEEIEQKHNIATFFECEGVIKPLGEDISAFLFRAVRELLVNVIKHAHAQNVRVSIKRNADTIRICVADDGIGFELAGEGVSRNKKHGYGLFSIKEHLSHLGGCLDIKSGPDRGTQAVLTATLKEKDIKAES
jgi:signal transduction histidine kinase